MGEHVFPHFIRFLSELFATLLLYAGCLRLYKIVKFIPLFFENQCNVTEYYESITNNKLDQPQSSSNIFFHN